MEKTKKPKDECSIGYSSKKILNFYKLKNTNSFISCQGRPTGKDLKFFKSAYGVNHVLTLQHQKEKPEEIKKLCEENSIKWQIIELNGANMPYFQKREIQKIITNGILEVYNILNNSKTVLFIHCAAGIHRTGTVIYCILRIFGESSESAMNAIKYIREETFEKVGEQRIKLAEECIIPCLLKSINSLNIADSKINV